MTKTQLFILALIKPIQSIIELVLSMRKQKTKPQTWIERVEQERDELLQKMENLRRFIESEKITMVSAKQAKAMRKSYYFMSQYAEQLNERIDLEKWGE